MKRFSRSGIDESNPVRVIDAFADAELGFEGVKPAATGGLLAILYPSWSSTSMATSAGSVESAAGTRSGAQRRGDVAVWSVGTGPRDGCGLAQRTSTPARLPNTLRQGKPRRRI